MPDCWPALKGACVTPAAPSFAAAALFGPNCCFWSLFLLLSVGGQRRRRGRGEVVCEYGGEAIKHTVVTAASCAGYTSNRTERRLVQKVEGRNGL